MPLDRAHLLALGHNPDTYYKEQAVKDNRNKYYGNHGNYWRVQAGDNVYDIARQVYGVGNERMMAEIIRLNGGASSIRPGMVLRLPNFKSNAEISISNDWAKNMGMGTVDELKAFYAANPGATGLGERATGTAQFGGWKNSQARYDSLKMANPNIARTPLSANDTAAPGMPAPYWQLAANSVNQNPYAGMTGTYLPQGNNSTAQMTGTYLPQNTLNSNIKDGNYASEGMHQADAPYYGPSYVQGKYLGPSYQQGSRPAQSFTGPMFMPGQPITGQTTWGQPTKQMTEQAYQTAKTSWDQFLQNMNTVNSPKIDNPQLQSGWFDMKSNLNPGVYSQVGDQMNNTLTGQPTSDMLASTTGSTTTPKTAPKPAVSAPVSQIDTVTRQKISEAMFKAQQLFSGIPVNFTQADRNLVNNQFTTETLNYLDSIMSGKPLGQTGTVTDSATGKWDPWSFGPNGSMPTQRRDPFAGRGGGGGGGNNNLKKILGNGNMGPTIGMGTWRGL